MFSTVLIPTNPQEVENDVATWGIELAESFDADVHVLAVLEGQEHRDELRTDREAEVREELDALVDRPGRGTVTHHVRSGEAAEEIIDAITDFDADLVVMGTHARTGVEKMLLGSVAESVIEQSPVPVLTVTPDADLPRRA